MNIVMSGLDHSAAPLELRERLSFTKTAAGEMVLELTKQPGVEGAVLLSTCNRTEVYLSCSAGGIDPGRLLCAAAGCSYGDFSEAFATRRGDGCARHLMEVSCGLRSQILGEDQIITQVKSALETARAAGAADACLETLFRTAASCGKEVKSSLRLRGLSGSAAESAVSALARRFGTLMGMRALVIGNGEMGRLTAALLRDAGCSVTVTLRSYRHGETVVPAGCSVVQYGERYSAMDGADVIVSATTSPHYTVTRERFAALERPPRAAVDLAIPRDIEPGVSEFTQLYNIDDLGVSCEIDPATLARARAAIDVHMERLHRWDNYRECIPEMDELRSAVLERVLSHTEPGQDAAEAAGAAAVRAVDLLLGGLSGCINPDMLRECASGIRARTR